MQAKKLAGADAEIVNCRTVKPLDEAYLRKVSKRRLISFEEGYAEGGFGSAVAEFYAREGIPVRLRILGADDVFVPHATAEEQAESLHLSAKDLAEVLGKQE